MHQGATNKRVLSGPTRALAEGVWFLIIALGAIAAFELPSHFGAAFFIEQYIAVFLGLVLFASFIAYGPTKRIEPEQRVPLYDLVAAFAGLGFNVYVGIVYEDILWDIQARPLTLVVLGTLTIVLVIEASRRVAGPAIAALGVLFIFCAFTADLMPGQLFAEVVPYRRLTTYLFLDSNALLGQPLAIALGIVLSFVLFGSVLFATGAGQFYTDIAMASMGRYSGGAGKMAVIASSLFGTISGSAVANVVATGVVTIPLMKRSGFTATEAGAIEAVASTGGQIMPPIMGATAFLIAEFLNVSYSTIVLAALVPALLYYGCAFLQIHLMARRRGLVGIETDPAMTVWRILKREGICLLPMVVILYALFVLHWRPEKAAFAATAATIVVYMLRVRGLGRGYWAMLLDAGKSVMDITLITAVAGIVIGVLNLTGLGFSLTLILTALGKHSLELLLLIVAILCVILGMGLPTAGIYLILAATVGPALAQLGVPDIAGHMFIFYFGVMSFVTPPVCFAAFAAATLSGAGPMRTGFLASRLGIVAYIVPFVFIYNPGLLMMASWDIVLKNAAISGLGIILLSIAVVGYSTRPLGLAERLLHVAAAGVMFLFCTPASPEQIVSVAVVAVVTAWLALHTRRSSVARPPTLPS